MTAPVFPSQVNYGLDLSCVTDLDPGMVEVTGRTCLVQALARRLITARGTLIDDPNYGFDLNQFLNDDLDAADVARIGSGIDAEFLKDERVLSSTTTAVLNVGGALVVTAQIQDQQGPFKLVLSVGSVSATILSITPS